MTITKTLNDGVLTFELEGWLDTTSSQELADRIDEVADISKLVFDFDKLEYISSVGLRQVATFAQKAQQANAAFSIINACEEVMSIFCMTGLDKEFDITEKTAE